MLRNILKIKFFIFILLLFSFCFFSGILPAQISSGGIGVILEHLPSNKTHRIRAVFKESPAARAKIIAGEEILNVDGISTQGMSFEELGNKIKGAVGSSVTLQLKDPKTQNVRNVQLTRIASQNVSPLIIKDSPSLSNTTEVNTLTFAEKEEVKTIIRKLTTEEQKKKMEALLIEFKSGKIIKGDFLQILRKTF